MSTTKLENTRSCNGLELGIMTYSLVIRYTGQEQDYVGATLIVAMTAKARQRYAPDYHMQGQLSAVYGGWAGEVLHEIYKRYPRQGVMLV